MKKFLAFTLSASMLLMLSACGDTTETEAVVNETATQVETTAASETEAEETTEAVEETTVEETTEINYTIPDEVIRYNVDNSEEFAEPVLYEVTEEAYIYQDWLGDKIIGTYPVGSCITGISSDGYYVMQDNGCIIELSHLQVLE